MQNVSTGMNKLFTLCAIVPGIISITGCTYMYGVICVVGYPFVD